MNFYITFKQTSPYKDYFAIVDESTYETAHEYARRMYSKDYSMVYTESQWSNYQGQTQAQRFNLKELK